MCVYLWSNDADTQPKYIDKKLQIKWNIIFVLLYHSEYYNILLLKKTKSQHGSLILSSEGINVQVFLTWKVTFSWQSM